jgi:protease YdgD
MDGGRRFTGARHKILLAGGREAARALFALAGFMAPAQAGPLETQELAGVLRPGDGLIHRAATFGSDDRVPLPARLKDLQEKLGLLFNLRTRTVCTAFCVAENVVATAGHCLHRTVGERPPRLADFWFARNYDAVRDFARIAGHADGSAAQNVMSGGSSLSVRPPIDASRDWALVRLARPICNKGVLPVRALSAKQILREARAERVFHVSYHRDFTPWRLAYSRACEVKRSFEGADWSTIAKDFSDPGHLILHTCDTGGASSGSPLLLDTPQGPQVIGINVGTYIQSKVLMQRGQVRQRLKADMIANTGVNATVFAAKLQAFRDAVILPSGPKMRALQGLLKSRQLYSGAVDGAYGPALRSAIEAFEKEQGLPVTGVPTQALLDRLSLGRSERKAPRPARS